MDEINNQSPLLASVKKIELSVPTPVIPKPALDVHVPSTEAAKSEVTEVGQPVESPKVDVKTPVKAEPVKAPEAAKDEPEAKPEATTPEEKAEVEKKERETARWANLAKQERKLELERTTLKEKEKAIKAETEANLAFQNEVAQIKNNPKKALEIIEKLGLSFEQLANYILNPEVVDKELENVRFREQYEKDKVDREKAEKENLTKQEASNIANYKSGLKDFIDSNINAYPLIRAKSEYDLVYDVMNEQYMKDKTEMDRSIAAKYVEDYLQSELDKLNEAKKSLSKDTKTESIAAEVSKDKKEVKATNEKTVPQKAKPVEIQKKTLTNLKTVLLPSPLEKAKSDKDRYARAAAALQKK